MKSCPNCCTQQEVRGSVHTCSNADCKLTAPSTAFSADQVAPRAWTISGNVD